MTERRTFHPHHRLIGLRELTADLYLDKSIRIHFVQNEIRRQTGSMDVTNWSTFKLPVNLQNKVKKNNARWHHRFPRLVLPRCKAERRALCQKLPTRSRTETADDVKGTLKTARASTRAPASMPRSNTWETYSAPGVLTRQLINVALSQVAFPHNCVKCWRERMTSAITFECIEETLSEILRMLQRLRRSKTSRTSILSSVTEHADISSGPYAGRDQVPAKRLSQLNTSPDCG